MMWLRYQIHKLKFASAPRKEFKAELRTELLTKLGQAPVYRVSLAFRYAFVPLALVLVLGVGTTSYAYASPSVSDGHVLYPLKTGVETVEQVFYRSPNSQTVYRVMILRHRADEANYQMDHDALSSASVIARVEEQSELMAEQLERVQYIERLRAQMQSRMKEQAVQTLGEFREKVTVAHIDEARRVELLRDIDAKIARMELY